MADIECNHEFINDRMCEDCGLIVEPLEMSRGWNMLQSRVVIPESFLKLVDAGISIEAAKNAFHILEKVCVIKKCILKGKRKKSLLFACLFDQLRGDPDKLRIKMNLTRKDCVRGIDLFEETIKIIKWDWSDVLREKCKILNMNHMFNLLFKQLVMSKCKIKMSLQMASCCIYFVREFGLKIEDKTVLNEFGVDKFIKWKPKKFAKKLKY
jgi:hypothetical protein